MKTPKASSVAKVAHEKSVRIILPGTGVADSFFEKSVQKILLTRFEDALADARKRRLPYGRACCWDLQRDETRLLQFPIRAYLLVDAMAGDLHHERDAFLIFYETEPVFMADLLAVLTCYHQKTEWEKDARRKLSEWQNTCEPIGPRAWADNEPVTAVPPANLLKLESFLPAGLSGEESKRRTRALQTKLGNIRNHRKETLKHWQRHFAACGLSIA